MALRPTVDQLPLLVDLGSLLEWAGLSNADATVQPIFGGTLASFLAFYGATPTTHFRQFAALTVDDFAACIPGWQPDGRAPTMSGLGAAKLAHRTARCLCGLDPWPPTEAERTALQQQPQPQQPQPGAQQQQQIQAFHGSLSQPSCLLNLATVNMSEVVDQRLSETITYLDDKEWLSARLKYRIAMLRDPPEGCDFTKEQLSALAYVLRTFRGPYVDFAVFGAHFARRAKRQLMTGMLFNAGGLLHKVELYGPPCLEDWLESWQVLGALLIALDAVSRPNLKAYKDFIITQAKMYGHLVWPLLYQTDVRCRSERMPLLRDRLVAAHEAALTAQRPSDFDAQRPWDAVFRDIISTYECTKWWEKEFEKPALLVITKTGSLDSMIEGDAIVEKSNRHAASGPPRSAPSVDEAYRGTQHSATQPRKKQRQASPQPRAAIANHEGPQFANGRYLCNRKRVPLCEAWNSSSGCKQGTAGMCGRTGKHAHQCVSATRGPP